MFQTMGKGKEVFSVWKSGNLPISSDFFFFFSPLVLKLWKGKEVFSVWKSGNSPVSSEDFFFFPLVLKLL